MVDIKISPRYENFVTSLPVDAQINIEHYAEGDTSTEFCIGSWRHQQWRKERFEHSMFKQQELFEVDDISEQLNIVLDRYYQQKITGWHIYVEQREDRIMIEFNFKDKNDLLWAKLWV